MKNRADSPDFIQSKGQVLSEEYAADGTNDAVSESSENAGQVMKNRAVSPDSIHSKGQVLSEEYAVGCTCPQDAALYQRVLKMLGK